MEIRQATLKDVIDVARVSLVTWPEHSLHAMALEALEVIQGNKGAYFLAYDGREVIGYAQVTVHANQVIEGENIAYLSGIFIMNNYRQQSGEEQLKNACWQWAKRQDCSEFIDTIEGEDKQSLSYSYTTNQSLSTFHIH